MVAKRALSVASGARCGKIEMIQGCYDRVSIKQATANLVWLPRGRPGDHRILVHVVIVSEIQFKS